MDSTIQANFRELDSEWVQLMLIAKKMGCTVEEIREFLQGSRTLNQAKNYPSSYELNR